MPPSRHSYVRFRHLDKVKRAVELRKEGKSFRLIGEAMGISTRYARDLVAEGFDRISAEVADLAQEVRAKNLKRLEDLLVAVWDDAMEGEPKAVDSAVKILAAQNRLTGADAPTKIDAGGSELNPAEVYARARQLGLIKEEPVQIQVKSVIIDAPGL